MYSETCERCGNYKRSPEVFCKTCKDNPDGMNSADTKSSFANVFSNFTKSTLENFPVDICTKKDPNSKDVYIPEDDVYYTLFIIDTRFHGYYEMINNCKPYICHHKGETLLGWEDIDGDLIDNLHNSIHMDNRCAIGFREEHVDEDVLKERWSEYKAILDAQWE